MGSSWNRSSKHPYNSLRCSGPSCTLHLTFEGLCGNKRLICTRLETATLTYNYTDNFLSPIPVSDWLIFCCGNAILQQKKKCK